MDREATKRHCNDLGDKFHYILKCDLFKDDWKLHIKQYHYRRPNTVKYNELLNTTNLILNKNSAIFVSKIMKKVK